MGIIMIRKAELKDIPAVMDIYNDAILHTTATFDTEIKDYEDRLAWFQAHTGQYVIFVYEEAGTVAGYASLSRYRERKAFDPAVEISIYIHAGYRGRGIGRSLMEKTLQYAKECPQIGTVVSLITSENEVSIRLQPITAAQQTIVQQTTAQQRAQTVQQQQRQVMLQIMQKQLPVMQSQI